MNKEVKIFLREVNKQDAETILMWENNPEFWDVTENEGPFSLSDIEEFVSKSNSLENSGQIRYMIIDSNEKTIGAIDLFEFNNKYRTAGIGILIADNENREKGIATEALKTVIASLKKNGLVKELHCIIHQDNIASIKLFLRCGFELTGESIFKKKQVNNYRRRI